MQFERQYTDLWRVAVPEKDSSRPALCHILIVRSEDLDTDTTGWPEFVAIATDEFCLAVVPVSDLNDDEEPGMIRAQLFKLAASATGRNLEPYLDLAGARTKDGQQLVAVGLGNHKFERRHTADLAKGSTYPDVGPIIPARPVIEVAPDFVTLNAELITTLGKALGAFESVNNAIRILLPDKRFDPVIVEPVTVTVAENLRPPFGLLMPIAGDKNIDKWYENERKARDSE